MESWTPAQPQLRGCVLAIEDVDERPFELDFALMQLETDILKLTDRSEPFHLENHL